MFLLLLLQGSHHPQLLQGSHKQVLQGSHKQVLQGSHHTQLLQGSHKQVLQGSLLVTPGDAALMLQCHLLLFLLVLRFVATQLESTAVPVLPIQNSSQPWTLRRNLIAPHLW
jgi:hypothetical protein